MARQIKKTLKPDIKGRITLGDLAKGVSSFKISIDKDHRILLEPFVEIPAREQWLFKNKQAIKRVKQGLEDAQSDKVKKRGSFADFKDEELDD